MTHEATREILSSPGGSGEQSLAADRQVFLLDADWSIGVRGSFLPERAGGLLGNRLRQSPERIFAELADIEVARGALRLAGNQASGSAGNIEFGGGSLEVKSRSQRSLILVRGSR